MKRKFEETDPDGILLVDKPVGMTSHDVVGAVRNMFRVNKAGHGGTLDPGATGLLVVLLGKATQISDRVMGGDKIYEGVLNLGAVTSTQDADGEVVETHDASGITQERLESVIKADFTGDIYQTPPMVSAVKINGVPLYKMARRGETVERRPRLVHIYSFKVLSFGIPESAIRVKCTKGTYIRTLCHDVGAALGCGGYLSGLRRICSGSFNVDRAAPYAELSRMTREEMIRRLVPVADFLSGRV